MKDKKSSSETKTTDDFMRRSVHLTLLVLGPQAPVWLLITA